MLMQELVWRMCYNFLNEPCTKPCDWQRTGQAVMCVENLEKTPPLTPSLLVISSWDQCGIWQGAVDLYPRAESGCTSPVPHTRRAAAWCGSSAQHNTGKVSLRGELAITPLVLPVILTSTYPRLFNRTGSQLQPHMVWQQLGLKTAAVFSLICPSQKNHHSPLDFCMGLA